MPAIPIVEPEISVALLFVPVWIFINSPPSPKQDQIMEDKVKVPHE